MSSGSNYLQAIGDAALAVTEGSSEKLLVYAEVEDGVVSADVFYVSRSGDVKFRFGPSSMRELIYEFWEGEKVRADGREWRTMAFVVEGGRFAVDFKYPDQIDPKHDLSDRRPDVVTQHFGSAKVDYSKPK